MKKSRKIFGISLLSLMVAVAPCAAQEKGGLDETGGYDVVVGWFKPGIDRFAHIVGAVAAYSPDRVYIGAVNRSVTPAGNPMLAADGTVMKEKTVAAKDDASLGKTNANTILVLNAKGEVIENWSQWDDEIGVSHHIVIDRYDPAHPVWVADRDNQQILKFTGDGKKLLLRLGERGVAGNDEGHFNAPASLTVMPDGSIYVADGYRNSRIVKFDKSGKYQMSWGTKGSEPGQFNLVHGVSVDAKRRVYVADRSNNRIQVFDEAGKFLDQWPNIRRPTRVMATEDGAVWVQAAEHRFAKYDLDGKLLYHWGMLGNRPGEMDNGHQFDVDDAGNLYVADGFNSRVQKFVPRKNGDKSHVLAREVVLKK